MSANKEQDGEYKQLTVSCSVSEDVTVGWYVVFVCSDSTSKQTTSMRWLFLSCPLTTVVLNESAGGDAPFDFHVLYHETLHSTVLNPAIRTLS